MHTSLLARPGTPSAMGPTQMRLTVASCRLQPNVAHRSLSCSSSFSGQRLRPAVLVPGTARVSRRRLSAAPVRASFFGVGAPEAILVGVVALVVFGPKGLAQAAKSLGSTLRAFQPTIRELTQVSAELKNTLEEEIGLNEIREEFRRPAVPPPRPAATSSASEGEGGASTSGGTLSDLSSGMQGEGKAAASAASSSADVDPDIERKRAESAKAAWGAPVGAAAPTLGVLSTEELEAELRRRKEAGA